MPDVPPYDDLGHSVNLKKLLHWSKPMLNTNFKAQPNRIISSLAILARNDKDSEFINLCTWLDEHHISFHKIFDKSAEGVAIELRQWIDVVDPKDANSIKFTLKGFCPDELTKNLVLYGIEYFENQQ